MRKLMAAVALAALAGLASAQAQTFPSRPITLVLALPAGGAVDALARIMVEHMRGTLGQPVIIENMGGAGGTLSIARVVRSDGACVVGWPGSWARRQGKKGYRAVTFRRLPC